MAVHRVWWNGRLWRRVGGSQRAPTLAPVPPDETVPAGALLMVHVKGVQHEGLACGDGHAVHKSQKRRRVVKESLDRFGGGRPVYIGPVIGGVDKAMARMGERWTPLENCQRFVAEVSGTPRRSKEALWGVAVVGGLIGLAGRLTMR